MDSIPYSNLFRSKLLPGAVAGAISSVVANYRAGHRAYRATRAEAPFVTSMARPVAKRAGARRPMRSTFRRRTGTKRGMSSAFRRVVRSSNVSSFSIAAATTHFSSINATLSTVQTSDLTATYRLYRLRKVVIHIVPRVDPANSGLASNFQTLLACACDPESTAAPASIQAITAYDNSYQKFVTAGDKYQYTFYPKVTNTVDNGGATAAGSYGFYNPWLRLDATGIQIPHLSLKLGAQCGSASTIAFDVYYDYHFEVKGFV